MESFPLRLRYLIDCKKISQVELSTRLQVSEAMVSKWLAGKVVDPRRKTLQKMADFFGCNIQWLEEGQGEIFPTKPITEATEGVEQAGSNTLVTESEALVLRTYRKLAKLDADFLLEVHAWLREEEIKRPGFSSWFRLEFANRFPEFAEWQEKISKKVA